MTRRAQILVDGVILGVLLLALPLLGVWGTGGTLARYMEFPPLTRYVEHAGFSWPVFVVLAAFIGLVVGPIVWRVVRTRGAVRSDDDARRRFPVWGWAGLGLGVAAWVLAWTRFPWFAPLQAFTFSPLWFAYIVVVNALTWQRTGRCMLTHRARHFAVLFPVSAAFWWFFEYLNRFVQNWYYVGIGQLTPFQYFLYATVPFSTVLPAVLGTYEYLASFPGLARGLADFAPVRVPAPRVAAAFGLALSAVGLACLVIWPDVLFPLLWVSPLLIAVCLQALRGRPVTFAELGRGDWRRVTLLALAALVCGFFWELWNSLSLAKWIYTVPYVNRFKIFEMPILGFAGYLPFGLECAVLGEAVGDLLKPGDGGEAKPASIPASWRGPARGLACLAIAAVIWLPVLHGFFKPRAESWKDRPGLSPMAEALAARQMQLWEVPALREAELRKMRGSNAEWDFMGRTFFVLSLANMSLRNPADADRYLDVMDGIIEETLRLEGEKGIYYFLMDYARVGTFCSTGKRSLFQDGEIALMLAARRLIREKEDYRAELSRRVDVMVAQMSESPVLCGESYPDECWMFCNAVAAAAIRMGDVLDGTDHSVFLDAWVARVKERLLDPGSGMLISSFGFDGTPSDGPEGSTIWMVAHCLQVVDRAFAEDQYRRARNELAGRFLGFGYAREWPANWKGPADIDSGPIIPFLEISAGSSGLAFLGAASFRDDDFMGALLTSLEYGGFPVRTKGALRYAASNQVGDAVLLYAMTQGPLWREVERRAGP